MCFVFFFFVVFFLTIETAVKGPSFKEKKKKNKKKKKHLKRVNQPEEVNGLGNIYVRKSMF